MKCTTSGTLKERRISAGRRSAETWEKMETDEYLDALEHPLAEAGWMKGAGKKVIVYRRPQRPELMYNLFDGIFPTVADVARFLKEFDEMNNHAVV